MKNFKALFMCLSLGALITSCENEKFNPTESDGEIGIRQQAIQAPTDFEIGEFTGCFNDMMDRVNKEPFEVQHGTPTDVSILYESDKGTYPIYPLVKNNEIAELLFSTDMSEGYFIEREGDLSSGDIIETPLTFGIDNLFDISPADLNSPANVRNIQMALGRDFDVAFSGKFLEIKEIGDFNQPGGGGVSESTKVQNICGYEDLADLYFIMFGFHDESGQFPDYVFDQQIMIDAINEIVPQNGYCYCPRPCLLQSLLNDNDDIPQDAKDQMNSSYVNYSFDLDPSFPIELVESELLEDLVDFACKPNSVTDLCTGETVTIDEIRDMLINPSNPFDPNITVESFYEEFNSNDFIIPDASFTDNEKVLCVWNKIINSDNALMCSTLSNFFGNSDINLYLYVNDFGASTANGFTDILDNGGFSISLDEGFVNEACPAEILKTILHEAMHAEILRRFKVYTIAELNAIYPVMMSYYNADDFHHEYMAAEMFGDLLGAVINFYPTQFTYEQYEAMTWSGLTGTVAFENSGLTASDIADTLEEMRMDCDKSCE